MQKKHTLLLGAHMSIAGGFDQAIIRGESIHCTAIQIFTKSNRQWQSKPITQEQADLFKSAMKSSSIKTSMVHASYLINIGSNQADLHAKSTAGLIEELARATDLNIPYLVLHPGASVNSTEENCIATISKTLDIVFEKVPGSTMILLENTAGQGSVVGYTFAQLAQIRSLSTHKKRIGICFDTCHAFASGYDFSSKPLYEKMWQQFDNEIGLEHLKAMHINDSKKGLNSRVDRHEDIGKGAIGLEAFTLIMNDKKLFDIPKILETPEADLDSFAKNMATLKELLTSSTKEALNL
jgi:deoxyribonuclease IV